MSERGWSCISLAFLRSISVFTLLVPALAQTSVGPTIQATSGVVNAATFAPGIAPATFISILGTNLSMTTRSWQAQDFVNNSLPTSLDGVKVSVNGLPCYISYISPTQVNVLTPNITLGSTATVEITNGSGQSSRVSVVAAPLSPALFAYPQLNGKYAVAQDGLTYELIGPDSLLGPTVKTVPAIPDEVIVLYATGLGPTAPAFSDGKLIQEPVSLARPVNVTIGGVAASVQYAGLIGAGLYQLNVRVPSLESGDARVEISIGGITSPSEVYLPIQQSATPGIMRVQISALPQGTQASILISSTNGFSTTLTNSGDLTLPAGTYSVTAQSVRIGSMTFGAAPSRQTITILGGSTVVVGVPYTAVYSNTTKVLDDAALGSLTLSSDGMTVYVPSSSPVAASVAVGDVIAAGPTDHAPNGLLRKVISVSRMGTQISLVTQIASLADAFQKIDLSITGAITVPSMDMARFRALAPGVSLTSLARRGTVNSEALPREGISVTPRALMGPLCPGTSFSQIEMLNTTFNTGPASLTLNGTLDVCAGFTFSISAEGHTLHSLGSSITVAQSVHVSAVGGLASSLQQEIPLGEFTGPAVLYFVGDIPLLVTPSAEFFLGVQADGKVSLEVGATEASAATLGFAYTDGATRFYSDKSSDFAADPAGIDAAFTGKFYEGARIILTIDESLAPNLELDAFVRADATATATPWWTLTAGIEGSVGAAVEIAGYQIASLGPYEADIYSKVIATSNGSYYPWATVTRIDPFVCTTGCNGQNLLVSGTNFVPGMKVNFGGYNGQDGSGITEDALFISPTAALTMLPKETTYNPGYYNVVALNPDPPNPQTGLKGFNYLVDVTPSIPGSRGKAYCYKVHTYSFQEGLYNYSTDFIVSVTSAPYPTISIQNNTMSASYRIGTSGASSGSGTSGVTITVANGSQQETNEVSLNNAILLVYNGNLSLAAGSGDNITPADAVYAGFLGNTAPPPGLNAFITGLPNPDSLAAPTIQYPPGFLPAESDGGHFNSISGGACQ